MQLGIAPNGGADKRHREQSCGGRRMPQKAVYVEMLDLYLARGWRFVANLPHGMVVIEREEVEREETPITDSRCSLRVGNHRCVLGKGHDGLHHCDRCGAAFE